MPQITEGKQKSLLVHTAGSIPMSVWEGHAERYGVFYPMQTFSKQREVDFQEVPFFIEAKRAEDVELLKAVAATLSEKGLRGFFRATQEPSFGCCFYL